VVPANTRAGISVKDPNSLTERQQVANKACKELNLRWPCLVDDMETTANKAYAACPTRLYVVDTEGKIAVASNRGPGGRAPSIQEAEKWLKAFTSRAKDKKGPPSKPGTP
jgi:hypothetical protein